MAFELSEAYVSLTNQGFDQTIKDTEGVEASLRKLMSGADAATESVDKGLVDAMANAAGEMLTTKDNLESATSATEQARGAIDKLSKQISALGSFDLRVNDDAIETASDAISDLSERIKDANSADIKFLDQITEGLAVLVESSAETKRLTEAVNAYDAEAQKPKKTVEELNAEIEKAKKNTRDAVKELKKLSAARPSKGNAATSSLSDQISEDKASLEAVKDRADGLIEKLSEGPSKFAQMVRGGLRLAGVIGVTVQAATKVYDWVLRWQEASSGFNDANKKALELVKKIGAQQNRIAGDAIRNANRLETKKQTLIAIEASLAKAREANDRNQRTKREKEDALTPGTFGQFADGKVNSELVPEFERAEAAADASAKSVEMFEKEIRKLKIGATDFEIGIAKELKRTKILATQGEDALREFDLVAKGLSKQNAAAVVFEENQLKLTRERKAEAENIASRYASQLQSLELQTLELTKGKEAAAQARDAIAKFTPEMRAQLAIARQQNAAAAMRKEKADEAAKLAEQEQKRQDSLNRSFAQQANALAAKNIALQKGNEAAERFKAEAKGFTEQQQAALAVLRERNRVLSEFDEAKKKEADINKAAEKAEGSFVGFADLAKAGAGNVESQQAQKETARATAALAKQAANEGIKIKDLATAAPRVDRRFGRGKGGA